MIEKSLSEIDLDTIVKANGAYKPSPSAWEDEVLYFMMLDRFSNDKEKDYLDINGNKVMQGSIPIYKPIDNANAVKTETDAVKWRDAGGVWAGGNLAGLTSKIGYLKRLGVTALWISPIFKQISFQDTYHGYGIQNFIDIDPHFGTREDLKKMVETAHDSGMYVILDIILNHAGNVFSYDIDRYWTKNEQTGKRFLDPRWDGNYYNVKGYNNQNGIPDISYGKEVPDSCWPDGAVWPKDFQYFDTFSRKGRINNWDYSPEFLEGDFCDLKDIKLGQGDMYNYQYSQALRSLVKVYQYWIAYADIDGFRVDTVKHMDDGAMRFFTSCIHEFTQSIGKENFYLIGEITGGRYNAFTKMEATGLDAALGINEIPGKLEYVAKGYTNPIEYFELFRHSLALGKDSHVWFRNKVVTMFDDHDQVRKGDNKARFCADSNGNELIASVMALNLLSEGIPCIYYGTEQGFDGQGNNDRYLREAMFGGEFGAFRSKNRHFFNEDNEIFKVISGIIGIRQQRIELKRGRQYLRQISGDGNNFGYPVNLGERMRSVIAWSRIFNDKEVLVAISTDPDNPISAWVTIDNDLHESGKKINCISSSDAGQIGQSLNIESRNGKAVYVTVPKGGYTVLS